MDGRLQITFESNSACTDAPLSSWVKIQPTNET
jgi:hypothetical protein